jgi:cobalt-zinc-cadmium efflux system outer membrane protein
MLPRIRAVAGLVAAFAVARPAPTRADEGAATLATLDEATFLKRVRDGSPRRGVLDARRRAADAQPGVASVLPNPTLSYERESVPGIDSTDDFFRLGFTLDVAGRRGLAVESAKAGAEAEKHEVEGDGRALINEARQAFLDALYARERAQRLDEARVALAQLVDVLQSRARQGDASSYDADRAALELDLLDDERTTARRVLATARLRLGGFIGEPQRAYDTTGTLALPAKSQERAADRPEIAAARARATQAEREVAIAERRWVPRLQLMVGAMASTSMNGSGIGYVVGLGGELPLFDRGARAAERARAESKRWTIEADARTTEIAGEVAQAEQELALRIDQAQAYVAGPGARAADLQRRAAVAYREGDRPILELLDVQRTSRQVVLRSIELVYEARRAELALQRALGRTP